MNPTPHPQPNPHPSKIQEAAPDISTSMSLNYHDNPDNTKDTLSQDCVIPHSDLHPNPNPNPNPPTSGLPDPSTLNTTQRFFQPKSNLNSIKSSANNQESFNDSTSPDDPKSTKSSPDDPDSQHSEQQQGYVHLRSMSPPTATTKTKSNFPDTSSNISQILRNSESNQVSKFDLGTPSITPSLQNNSTSISTISRSSIGDLDAEAELELQQLTEQAEQAAELTANKNRTNLIVNYLPPSVDEDTLVKLFSPFGKCQIRLVRDFVTKISLCYAFVKYQNPSSAAAALSLNSRQLLDKKLKISYARPRSKTHRNANLYVSSIPFHVQESEIRKLFSAYGTVINCKLLTEASGKSRGIAFVRFDSHQNATRAFNHLNSSTTFGSPILIKFAEPPITRIRRGYNRTNQPLTLKTLSTESGTIPGPGFGTSRIGTSPSTGMFVPSGTDSPSGSGSPSDISNSMQTTPNKSLQNLQHDQNTPSTHYAQNAQIHETPNSPTIPSNTGSGHVPMTWSHHSNQQAPGQPFQYFYPQQHPPQPTFVISPQSPTHPTHLVYNPHEDVESHPSQSPQNVFNQAGENDKNSATYSRYIQQHNSNIMDPKIYPDTTRWNAPDFNHSLYGQQHQHPTYSNPQTPNPRHVDLTKLSVMPSSHSFLPQHFTTLSPVSVPPSMVSPVPPIPQNPIMNSVPQNPILPNMYNTPPIQPLSPPYYTITSHHPSQGYYTSSPYPFINNPPPNHNMYYHPVPSLYFVPSGNTDHINHTQQIQSQKSSQTQSKSQNQSHQGQFISGSRNPTQISPQNIPQTQTQTQTSQNTQNIESPKLMTETQEASL